MNDGRGLDLGEQIVLEDLADSPVPLGELGRPEAPSRQRVAEVCGPGVVSWQARGFIEARRLENRPEPGEHGRPIGGDELLAESRRIGRWTSGAGRTHLVAGAGERFL